LAGKRGRLDDEQRLLTQSYDIRRALYGDIHPDVAESLYALAHENMDGAEMPHAERRFRKALDVSGRPPANDLPVAASQAGRSILLVAAGRYEEAEPLLQEALQMRRRLLGPGHFDVARTLTDLGEIYLTWGDYDKAEACHREQVQILRKLFPSGHVAL